MSRRNTVAILLATGAVCWGLAGLVSWASGDGGLWAQCVTMAYLSMACLLLLGLRDGR